MTQSKLLTAVPPNLRQFALYVLCGGSGVALDFATYSALVMAGFWYHGANISGYFAGTILSFILNRVITFGVRDAPIRRLATFLGVAVLGYVASTLVLTILIDMLHLGPIVSKACSIVVVIAIQYKLNSSITFRPTS